MNLILKLISRYRFILKKILDLMPVSLQHKLKIWYSAASLKNSFFLHSYNKYDLLYENEKYCFPSHVNKSLAKGVNILGLVRGDLGLGEHARLTGKAFDASGYNFSYYNLEKYAATSFTDRTIPPFQINQKLPYNTNIFICNADVITALHRDEGDSFFNDKYNIQYGAWELRNYPKEWIKSLGFFNEYWAMSSYLQQIVSDISKIPVILMPFPVEFTLQENIQRGSFGLPEDRFLFMFSFDLSSSIYRKNPQGVLKSFLMAFPKEKQVGLVIKVNFNKRLKSHAQYINDLKELAAKDDRIYLINEVLSRDGILGLLNASDVYVSLHRSEGFGIGMAEAMKMQKVVIATNYSGNTDFTLHSNSCPVDYKLIDVKEGEYMYHEGQKWAEPDLEHAAFYMKKLYEDRSLYKRLSVSGKKFIDENFNAKSIGDKYITRLKLLGLL
ncbi:MAG: glycosyltransferase family 4 protein [Rickettsiaceae bacterium]|nr:glycosyltransferase family 4 protein [Rickettsiaceae bacterium]